MSLIGIASLAGITSDSLKSLVMGKVSTNVGYRLGIMKSSLQSFIDGQATTSVAGLLGTTTSNAQELRNLIGREGAIGLILRLCMERKI